MQALTPSFLGDGPDTWLINPNLPNGLVIDRETGIYAARIVAAAKMNKDLIAVGPANI